MPKLFNLVVMQDSSNEIFETFQAWNSRPYRGPIKLQKDFQK